MEILDDLGGEGVALAGFAVAVVAGIAEIERTACGDFGFVGGLVADEGFLCDLRKGDAADLGWHAGEGEIDHVRADADGLEGLRALIRIEDGDAHLGHDFQQAFFECLAVVRHRFLRSHALAELAGVRGDELADGGVA